MRLHGGGKPRRSPHHSPLTTHHSPLTTHHSPLTTHHSPLTTHDQDELLMSAAVLILAILLPILMGAAFLLGRTLQYRRSDERHELSPVSRQHIDLFQGGQLNEAVVESTK